MSGSSEPEPWEQWPGRGSGADRPGRRGLRALFTPSDGVDEVEQLIDERGRELQHRVESLHRALADLDEREQRVSRLQASVEGLLRDGAAELDERHAEVARAALELTEREERIASAERDLEERRTELGAVELRRAAADRRDEALERRHAELERLADEIRERSAELDERARSLDTLQPAPTPVPRDDVHVLVVPRDGYRLLEQRGPVPAVDTELELDGVRYRLARSGPSPLPADDRRCGFLERL